MPVPRKLIELAESASTSLSLAPGDKHFEDPARVVFLRSGSDHPEFSVVRPLKMPRGQVASIVAGVRRLLSRHGRKLATWEIGPSARPSDLEKILISLGMRPYVEPRMAGMVLQKAPEIRPMRIQTRRAQTVDDYAAALEVLNHVFRQRSVSPTDLVARAKRERRLDLSGRGAIFQGLLDGRLVAAARSIYLPHAVVLGAGAVLESARGLGAYRALVAARYDDAARRKTPALVVQAGPMSRPILERLGFATVAEIRVLIDEHA